MALFLVKKKKKKNHKIKNILINIMLNFFRLSSHPASAGVLSSFVRAHGSTSPLNHTVASAPFVASADDDLLASDEQALRDIFNEGGGPSWADPAVKSTWLVPGVPPCSWAGVTCERVDGQVVVVDLRLVNLGIVSLSRSVGMLSKLRVLSVASNLLESVPEEIGLLQHLQQLGLGSNMISSLPSSLTKMRSLKVLSVVNNDLTALPDGLHRMESLQRLILNENRLTALPPSISQMTNLSGISVSDNPVTVVPDLSGLVNLEYLRMANMRLSELPRLPLNSSLQNLEVSFNNLVGTVQLCSPTLAKLNFNSNPQLTGIGPFPRFGSCLPELTTIDASGCGLLSVSFLNGSSNLEDLDLSSNINLGDAPVAMAKALAWPLLKSMRIENINIRMTIAEVMAAVLKPGLLSLDLSRNEGIHGRISVPDFSAAGAPTNLGEINLLILRLDNTRITYLQSTMELRFNDLRILSLRNTPIAVEIAWDKQRWPNLEALDVRGSINPDNNITKPVFLDVKQTAVDLETYSTCPSTLQGGTSSTYTILASPVTYNYTGCECLDLNFGEPWLGCQACPVAPPNSNVGIQCKGIGNEFNVTGGWLFFSRAENRIAVKPCPSDSHVSPCRLGTFHLTVRSSEEWRQKVSNASPRPRITTCEPGYESRMCSKCTTGYFKSGRSCIKCGHRMLSLVNPVLSLGILTLLGVKMVSLGPKSRSGLARTLTSHAQLISVLPSLELKISDVVSLLVRSGGGAGGLRLNGLECEGGSGWDGFYGPFVLACLFPLQVVAASAWVALLARFFVAKRVGRAPFASMFKTAFLYLWFAMLFAASEKLFAPLNCTTYGSTSRSKYIASALWLPCKGPSYLAVKVVAGVLGPLYLFGTMLVMAWKLYRHRNGFPSEISEFLAAPFKQDQYYYWELAFFFRRMALVLISALAPLSAGPAVIFMVSFVLLVSLVTHTARLPFSRSGDNTTETISLLLLLSSYAVGLSGSSSSTMGRERATGLLLMVLNGLFIFGLTFLVLFRARTTFRSFGRSSEAENDPKKAPLLLQTL
jgi:Leucine-rich repeat (LRR) protein